MSDQAEPDASQTKSRVFIVDDHPVVRQGLAQLINREPDLAVCGEAGESQAALDAISVARPDILLLDISLAGPDGLELLKNIRLRDAQLPVLVLSMHDESTYAERALRAGANGYIMKQEATERVLIAIRRTLSGEVYVSERVADRLLHQYLGRPKPVTQSPVDSLTDRELEVFRLIGEGYGTRQIAEELRLSVKTVESHQARIKEKLSFHSARELVQHAVQWVIGGKTQG
ncbi:MAG: response regulator transcription factor [Terriglobia bacterium]